MSRKLELFLKLESFFFNATILPKQVTDSKLLVMMMYFHQIDTFLHRSDVKIFGRLINIAASNNLTTNMKLRIALQLSHNKTKFT